MKKIFILGVLLTGFSNNFRPKFKPNYDNFKFDLNEDVFQKVDLK